MKYLLMILLILLTGCTPHQLPDDDKSMQKTADLAGRIVALDARIDADEATQLAHEAVHYSLEQARIYRMAGSPRYHNLMINLGVRSRGLCYHWTDDLLAHLEQFSFSSLQLHSVVAHRGSELREHSAVVVTYKGALFTTGIVLDGWRYSGDLFFSSVSADEYPWELRYNAVSQASEAASIRR